jgi:N-acetylgalactosamine kinase
MERAVKGSLKEEPYKMDEIQQLLGVSVQSVFASNVSLMESLHANQSDGFKLQQRALHVFSEVSRTQAFVQAAADGDTATLAGAIDASHESLRDWYECSCPELDQLVTAMREGGARGARLTGAGWGGCAVAVVEESMLEGMLEHVKRAFYNNIGTDAIFATVPGIGACLFYES